MVKAARYLAEERPDLAFVHFSDPDEAGHSRGWLSEPYRKYLADQLRRAFGYEGCPIVLTVKPRPKSIPPVRTARPEPRHPG